MEKKTKIFSILILNFFFFILCIPALIAQHGGIGVKFTQQTYDFSKHPTYEHTLSSLYISIKLGKNVTIFIDSYLYSTEGDGFDTGDAINSRIELLPFCSCSSSWSAC